MLLRDVVLAAASATGLSALARRATRGRLRILCYHGVWVTPGLAFGDCTFIAPEQFASRMARLKRSGRPVLPLGEAVDRLAARDLPPAAVVITIDDGWVSTLTHMLPVLEALDLPATLYVTSWYAGRDLPVVNLAVDYLLAAAGRRDIARADAIAAIERLPVGERLAALRAFGARLGVDEAWLESRQFNIMGAAEIAAAQRRGLDIQLHTHRHIDVATRIDELAAEIDENRAWLRDEAGATDPVHFCYPGGGNHSAAGAILAGRNVRSATLVDSGLNAPDADPFYLRRLLDGRGVSDRQFDAYLSGTLHYLSGLRTILARAG
jgi:peptidoglycan/xylan/chitin deacetylase (PgdA/CDA1 family)